ncbi:MAG: cysteine desulfurase [Gammaproteobacteria bacterium]|nr:cysteine desulfurase [Gammaproteobacteria bacterium]
MVYLDHNATTPLDERVLEAMLPYLRERYGNPSSVHAAGREARSALEMAREQVAALVNAHPSQVIFTSGGTEANNAALKGFALGSTAARLVLGPTEHASIRRPAEALGRHGWQVGQVGCDADGVTCAQTLSQAVDDQTRLVSVMWANNESGAINPIAELAAVCRERGVPLHSDAVQAAGKLPLDFAASGLQLMSLSAHKLYGPKGAGALIVDKALGLEPLLHGGGQERERRGGTENVAAIVGFGRAAELAQAELVSRQQQTRTLRERFEQRLSAALPQAVIFATGAERLPNTSFFAVPPLEGRTLIMALDQRGFAVASGSACGSGQHEPSHVLKAMGVASAQAHGAVRVSFGQQNSDSDIERLITALVSQTKQLQGMGAATAWT